MRLPALNYAVGTWKARLRYTYFLTSITLQEKRVSLDTKGKCSVMAWLMMTWSEGSLWHLIFS